MYVRDHWNLNAVESMERTDALKDAYPGVAVVNVLAKDYAYIVLDGDEYEVAFYTKDGKVYTGDCFDRRWEY